MNFFVIRSITSLYLSHISSDNAYGGKLLFGVNNDGTVYGVEVVDAGSERPYYLANCYYRVGDSCSQMPEKMIRELYSKRVSRTIANIESPDQNLTFQVLEIYYRNHGLTLTDQFAKNLDFLTPDGRYNFVAYLFSDNNHLTFKVAKYAGKDKCDLIESSEYGFGCLL